MMNEMDHLKGVIYFLFGAKFLDINYSFRIKQLNRRIIEIRQKIK